MPAPMIVVSGNSIEIISGDASPDVSDHTDFNNVGRYGTGITRTFTINNDGDADLTIGAITVPTGFTMIVPPDDTVLELESTTFQVRLDSAVAGVKSGNVSIVNNDGASNPFTFAITGEVILVFDVCECTLDVVTAAGDLIDGAVMIATTPEGVNFVGEFLMFPSTVSANSIDGVITINLIQSLVYVGTVTYLGVGFQFSFTVPEASTANITDLINE